MINEIKLRELFDNYAEKYGITSDTTSFLHLPERIKESLYRWFCFGFVASYRQPLTLKIADPLTPEKREAIKKQLKDTGFRSGHIVVEPDNKLIFVYSWRSAQQRTMIILADSREEADTIFESEEPYISPYVTQLFVDGGESTIIYNN
ncbi:nitrogen regulatory protein P-II [Pseudanabaena phage Pam2]|nr:nitrogen regulatory protein P-II [Pseudanabaena phage Pam2]